MKTQMLLSLACSISLLAAVTVSASAQSATSVSPQPTVQPLVEKALCCANKIQNEDSVSVSLIWN
jgi:hypothetical protein